MASKATKKGAAAPKTQPATATPATVQAAPATPAKAAKPAAVVQNGVQRPRAGGLCAAVWELTEAGMVQGPTGPTLPAIGAVKVAAQAAGLNPTNVSIEYYRCRQFHGVRGRVKAQPVA